jgi:hypothetical protein
MELNSVHSIFSYLRSYYLELSLCRGLSIAENITHPPVKVHQENNYAAAHSASEAQVLERGRMEAE